MANKTPETAEISKALALDVKTNSTSGDCSTNDISSIEKDDLSRTQVKLLVEQINDISHYRGMRETYAKRVFGFMCAWAGLVFAFLIVKGFWSHVFVLSDIIFTTLVGGTTVSVVGLVGFMMQGLFGSNKH